MDGCPYAGAAETSLDGKPPVRGPADGEAPLMSCRDPLAGPGPSGPAETGTPVSATVGSAGTGIGTGLVEDSGTGGGAVAEGETAGIGAGELFNASGLIGVDDGETEPWRGLEGRGLLSALGGVSTRVAEASE